MGLHFTQPYRLAAAGKLSCHTHTGAAGRQITFFDGGECDENWCDYAEAVAGDGTGKRARTAIGDRPKVLKYLASVQQPIPLSDAIPTPEAARIMGGMQPSYAIRLAEKGKVVARKLWSPRSTRGPVQWMFSRKSCKKNLADAAARHAAGKMPGLVRKDLRKK